MYIKINFQNFLYTHFFFRFTITAAVAATETVAEES